MKVRATEKCIGSDVNGWHSYNVDSFTGRCDDGGIKYLGEYRSALLSTEMPSNLTN